jgi:hypothetical protein
MTQTELHRAVARATRESVNTVRKLGFVLVVPRDRMPRRGQRPRPAGAPANGPQARASSE